MSDLAAVNPTSLIQADIAKLQRIRDLWANRVQDDEIRDVLGMDMTEWKRLMTVLKENALPDNHIEYEKFLAKTSKRQKELERVRNTAEAVEELSTAVKCFQLEHDMDKSLLEIGQKLNVLKPEIIKVEGEVQHDVRLAALFANLSPDKQPEATDALKELVQDLVTEGFIINDAGSGAETKG
jgi:hypothetical protein